MASKTVVLYLSDAIVASPTPIVVTIDAQSPAILTIERAAERSAETWSAPGAARDEHGFHRTGMASDRGVGLVAGSHAACAEALWVCEYLHAFRDLFSVCHPWESKASAAIRQADEAAQKFAHAKSASNLHQRLQQDEHAHQRCEHAMAIYDQLAILLHLLREAWHIGSPHGRLRTTEGVRSELTLL